MSLTLGVLASGRGSNFLAVQQEIEAGRLDAAFAVLISDQPDAPALSLAEQHGIPTRHFPYDRSDRSVFEHPAAELLEHNQCDLILLAGFMRILTPDFIQRFPGKILNIHPSLLPSFKGLHPQRQALEAGVKYSGCTVHVVTADLDAGPIIAQAVVPVMDGDTEETLSDRILKEEHKIYADAIRHLTERGQVCP
jgi:phosphoribosylglycinamide formyltransferase-1